MKLIDADALKKEITRAPVWTALSVKEMIDELNNIEIVRCKECKHRKKNGFCLEHNRYEKKDNGYCSYGERKTDE